MQAKKRRRLEAAGWKFGDAADFLGMSEEERQLLRTRASAVRANDKPIVTRNDAAD
jgi:hypothetical protein